MNALILLVNWVVLPLSGLFDWRLRRLPSGSLRLVRYDLLHQPVTVLAPVVPDGVMPLVLTGVVVAPPALSALLILAFR